MNNLLVLLVFFLGRSLEVNLKCAPRDYGNGGTVCVCHESYCDTVEPPPPLTETEFHVYLSSLSGHRFEYEKKKFQQVHWKSDFQITINSNKSYQKIYGFGGAFTDSACMNINSLKPKVRQKLLESYFSPQGIEYTFGRVPIGGTDFSTRKYTLDDVPNDFSLAKFNLTAEDFHFKIPVILDAQRMSRKGLKLMGAAWSAPPWMKTNNDYTCFGLLKTQYYDLWARYHIKFLEEYKKFGLKFWAITTGNEPMAGLLPYYPFNCLGWIPSGQSKWVAQNLGPQIKASPFKDTKIIGIDDQRLALFFWPKKLFQNAETRSLIDGIGVHWYWDNFVPSALLDFTHSAFPEKFIFYTEACFVRERGKPAVVLGSWDRGEKYASNIINNINHFVGAWIDWNLALDPKGGPNWVDNVVDSPVIVNASSGEFYKQPMFYALGHFSKFVPEGSVRVDTIRSHSNLVQTCAFLTPDNNIVLVLLNRKSKPLSVNVHGSSKGTASLILPQKSIVTLIYKN